MESAFGQPTRALRRPSTLALPANMTSDAGPEVRSRLKELLDYWDMKRRLRGQLPGRNDMDPLDLLTLLPDIFLIDSADAEPDLAFQFRLIGENVGRIDARMAPGMLLTDVFPGQTANMLCQQCRRVTRSRAPESRIVPLANYDGGLKRVAHTLAPLAEDGENVDTLIGLAIDTTRDFT